MESASMILEICVQQDQTARLDIKQSRRNSVLVVSSCVKGTIRNPKMNQIRGEQRRGVAQPSVGMIDMSMNGRLQV